MLFECLKILLDNGFDLHKKDTGINGFFSNFRASDHMLCYLSRNGHTDSVKLLLDRGVVIEKMSSEVLYEATENGHTEIAKSLLDHGVCMYQFDDEPGEEDYVLYAAASHGHTDTVRLLIERGIWKNGDKNEWDAGAIYSATSGGHRDTVKLMLDLGSTNSNAIFEAAAFHGQHEILKMLIERGYRYTAGENVKRCSFYRKVITETINALRH